MFYESMFLKLIFELIEKKIIFLILKKKNFFKNFTIDRNFKFKNFTNLIKNNFIIFFFYNNSNRPIKSLILSSIKTNLTFNNILIYLLDQYKRICGDGFIYIRGLFIIFFIDACVTDDEPL